MKWASTLRDARLSKRTLTDLLEECFRDIRTQLDGQSPDLLAAFVSPHFIDDYDKVPLMIREALSPVQFIGCSASGLIGGGFEIEQQPAVALTAAILPGVKIETFHLVNVDMPDLDAAPDKWMDVVKVRPEDNPHFILIPDPFSFLIDNFVQGLDYAFPRASKIGGLASGARRPTQNALYLNEHLYRNGMVGAALYGDLEVDTIVAQGCRPIGKPLRITQCQKNFILQIEGKPALEALHEVIEQLAEPEQELARQALFLGIAMDEFRDEYRQGDFLIRNIIGIEPNSGALVVSELMREEQTIQFHVRDAETSADDLKSLLKRYHEKHGDSADGALLFSCLGRGEHLYGIPNHDSDCFKEFVGQIPLGGFFCNGEIGPVGGTTFLHGYTSSFGIFRGKSS